MSASKLTGLGFDGGSIADEPGDDDALTTKTRSVVVAIEKTEDALSCVKYVAENILKGEVRDNSVAFAAVVCGGAGEKLVDKRRKKRQR